MCWNRCCYSILKEAWTKVFSRSFAKNVITFLMSLWIVIFMFSFMCLSLSCRELLNQTYKERRVLLTRDVKLLKYQYLTSNQVYRVKSLLKHDQLAEVCTFFFLSSVLLICKNLSYCKCFMAQSYWLHSKKSEDWFQFSFFCVCATVCVSTITQGQMNLNFWQELVQCQPNHRRNFSTLPRKMCNHFDSFV